MLFFVVNDVGEAGEQSNLLVEREWRNLEVFQESVDGEKGEAAERTDSRRPEYWVQYLSSISWSLHIHDLLDCWISWSCARLPSHIL